VEFPHTDAELRRFPVEYRDPVPRRFRITGKHLRRVDPDKKAVLTEGRGFCGAIGNDEEVVPGIRYGIRQRSVIPLAAVIIPGKEVAVGKCGNDLQGIPAIVDGLPDFLAKARPQSRRCVRRGDGSVRVEIPRNSLRIDIDRLTLLQPEKGVSHRLFGPEGFIQFFNRRDIERCTEPARDARWYADQDQEGQGTEVHTSTSALPLLKYVASNNNMESLPRERG